MNKKAFQLVINAFNILLAHAFALILMITVKILKLDQHFGKLGKILFYTFHYNFWIFIILITSSELTLVIIQQYS